MVFALSTVYIFPHHFSRPFFFAALFFYFYDCIIAWFVNFCFSSLLPLLHFGCYVLVVPIVSPVVWKSCFQLDLKAFWNSPFFNSPFFPAARSEQSLTIDLDSRVG